MTPTFVLPAPEPIWIDTPTNGKIQMTHVSMHSLGQLSQLERLELTPEEFTTRALHLHLVSPKPSHSRFRKWPEADLQLIAQEWAGAPSTFATVLADEDIYKAFHSGYQAAKLRWTDGMSRAASRFAAAINEQSKAFASVISGAAQQFDELNQRLAEALRPFTQAIAALPVRLQKAHEALASAGWYSDQDLPFPLVWELAELAETDQVQVVDEVMADHVRKQVRRIREDLCKRFPLRAGFLRAAFRAHERREFELSIPTFLAQADGISIETFGCQLYKHRNGTPVLRAYRDALPESSWERALVHSLTIPTPLTSRIDDSARSFAGLNRHAVLHGIALDYASELNGLKAISLINWVAWASDRPGLKTDGK